MIAQHYMHMYPLRIQAYIYIHIHVQTGYIIITYIYIGTVGKSATGSIIIISNKAILKLTFQTKKKDQYDAIK